jgi:hypothetical protein
MRRLRADLADLEADLAEQRYQRSIRTGMWRDRAVRSIAWLEPRVKAARACVPVDLR